MKRLFILACVSLTIVACGEVTPGENDDMQAICGEAFVACGNQCVDPKSDPVFCGAASDCAGINAGTVCPVGSFCSAGRCAVGQPTPLPPNPAELCTNGSFESGTLTGWVVRDVAIPTYPIGVGGVGVNPYGFFDSRPSHGEFALLTGFDGAGPGVISAGQTIDLPSGTSAILTFDYRAAWDLQGFGATQPRSFSVAVSGAAGQPLAAETVLVAEANTLVVDTGVIQRSIDLSPFMGQTISIEFLWDVPEDHTGPSFFQLDNVDVVAQ